MKKVIFVAMASAVAVAAHAANVSVVVDGGSAVVYTLTSMQVDASGNVVVNATSGAPVTGYILTVSTPNGTYSVNPAPTDGSYAAGTQVTVTATPNSGYTFSSWGAGCDSTSSNTCTVTMNANRTVAASFAASSSGGGSGSGTSCTPTSTLTCVDTSLPTSAFSRQAYRPDATMVYAFKMNTPATGTYTGAAIATVQTGSMTAKLLVISETPGDVSLSGKSSACYAQGTETSRINYVVNNASANQFIYCKLDSNKTYYINASSGNKYNSSLTCNSPSTCAFYFEGR